MYTYSINWVKSIVCSVRSFFCCTECSMKFRAKRTQASREKENTWNSRANLQSQFVCYAIAAFEWAKCRSKSKSLASLNEFFILFFFSLNFLRSFQLRIAINRLAAPFTIGLYIPFNALYRAPLFGDSAEAFSLALVLHFVMNITDDRRYEPAQARIHSTHIHKTSKMSKYFIFNGRFIYYYIFRFNKSENRYRPFPWP